MTGGVREGYCRDRRTLIERVKRGMWGNPGRERISGGNVEGEYGEGGGRRAHSKGRREKES